ncbi:hypothetical protein GQ43DRAFT_485881 [Delitschia confertaspora ATCC 74209]|uniref:PD-(D/E)XK nuclease-like domain-containing protein n=1 Tax=Delitschia confertaspora ATCC 74209 TaxID=1513339 RepID=A0A9P4JT01_9PLEO|nr:hypothetical protein GQ43DRAFT_485881 [Delitschia confertaspora ATCC 74209]
MVFNKEQCHAYIADLHKEAHGCNPSTCTRGPPIVEAAVGVPKFPPFQFTTSDVAFTPSGSRSGMRTDYEEGRHVRKILIHYEKDDPAPADLSWLNGLMNKLDPWVDYVHEWKDSLWEASKDLDHPLHALMEELKPLSRMEGIFPNAIKPCLPRRYNPNRYGRAPVPDPVGRDDKWEHDRIRRIHHATSALWTTFAPESKHWHDDVTIPLLQLALCFTNNIKIVHHSPRSPTHRRANNLIPVRLAIQPQIDNIPEAFKDMNFAGIFIATSHCEDPRLEFGARISVTHKRLHALFGHDIIIPPIPLVLTTGERWELWWALQDENRAGILGVEILEGIEFGAFHSMEMVGIYQAIAVLRALGRWLDTEWRAWIEGRMKRLIGEMMEEVKKEGNVNGKEKRDDRTTRSFP